MTKQTLNHIAGEILTPAYIFDISDFHSRISLVKEYFGKNISLCFSIKANPFLTRAIPSEISRIEVCSPGELTICEKVNADMAGVIYSGVNKGTEDIRRAITDGVGVITAESTLHIEKICVEAQKQNKIVNVLLRLSSGNQFGVDKNTFTNIIQNREQYQNTRIIGLHYFSGTQKKKAEKIKKELDDIDEFLTELKAATGYEISNVEYGTGLAVDYFSPDADELEIKRLNDVAVYVKSFAKKYNLTIEMGRFFAASCGYYLTKAVDIKTNYNLNYAICDGGLHQLKYFGQIPGMNMPQITHISQIENDEKAEKWNLCGSLCTASDVMANAYETTPVTSGDIFVFHKVGAYSFYEGMSLFLSRDLPRIYITNADDIPVLFRERIDTDIFNS